SLPLRARGRDTRIPADTRSPGRGHFRRLVVAGESPYTGPGWSARPDASQPTPGPVISLYVRTGSRRRRGCRADLVARCALVETFLLRQRVVPPLVVGARRISLQRRGGIVEDVVVDANVVRVDDPDPDVCVTVAGVVANRHVDDAWAPV